MANNSYSISYPLTCIIPVLHETSEINACIAAVFSCITPEHCEVIVVDGDSDGSTIRHINHPNVISVCAPRGRGVQMNVGAQYARGERLIFLHADTRLPEHALSRINMVLDDPRYVAGAFRLGFDSPRRVFRLIETAAAFRCHLSKLPYGDQALFMSKRYFMEIGGFAAIPIMEDIDLMRRVKRRGDRICILHDAVTTSARRWEHEGVLYCIIRTLVLASLFCTGVNPHILAKYYSNWPGTQAGKLI